jgi:hypothetical protein
VVVAATRCKPLYAITVTGRGWCAPDTERDEPRRRRVRWDRTGTKRASEDGNGDVAIAPQTAKPRQMRGLCKWAIQDSNLGPLPYQRSALTD